MIMNTKPIVIYTPTPSRAQNGGILLTNSNKSIFETFVSRVLTTYKADLQIVVFVQKQKFCEFN